MSYCDDQISQLSIEENFMVVTWWNVKSTSVQSVSAFCRCQYRSIWRTLCEVAAVILAVSVRIFAHVYPPGGGDDGLPLSISSSGISSGICRAKMWEDDATLIALTLQRACQTDLYWRLYNAETDPVTVSVVARSQELLFLKIKVVFCVLSSQ
jgi:hypothetical protein